MERHLIASSRGFSPGRQVRSGCGALRVVACLASLTLLAAQGGQAIAGGASFEQLKPADLQRLGKLNLLEYWRINLSDAAHDIPRIRSAGVVLVTVEPRYVLVEGDAPRLARLRELGFVLSTPQEPDYVRRLFRVWVADKEGYTRLRGLIDDVFPFRGEFPAYIHGRSLDSGLQWARDAGFPIEICKTTDCP